jgi:hypothetical protein
VRHARLARMPVHAPRRSGQLRRPQFLRPRRPARKAVDSFI